MTRLRENRLTPWQSTGYILQCAIALITGELIMDHLTDKTSIRSEKESEYIEFGSVSGKTKGTPSGHFWDGGFGAFPP
jgi:hypothetical protein